MLGVLLRDLEELGGHGVVKRETLSKGLNNLAQMGVSQGLGALEQEIRGVLKNSFLKHLLNDSVRIFESARKEGSGGRAMKVSTQNDQVKSRKNEIASKISDNDQTKCKTTNIPLSSQMTSKTQKKIPDFDLPGQQDAYLERNNENTPQLLLPPKPTRSIAPISKNSTPAAPIRIFL